ncbi:PREDICTED: uncharacterized protein LOC107328544 isoform X2 [Acropora digitifera]|uniref:uncharacterized protein LOC107328544 isoform X2 n=1 Tax=Acropora digitifera TaxID=70779 RepID=UPI00077AB710|nr:PREDICTED: uncharacterized protein LOC107328544 isoform X2 [Acropora digitifera]
MEESRAVVSRVRVLAITHILVGTLLIICGIADSVVKPDHDAIFSSGYGYFGIATGIWMSIAGALGIRGSAPQRTRKRNCFAGTFMGFAITSAVLGGMIIILYSTSGASCQKYCENYCGCGGGGGYGHGNVSTLPHPTCTYPYSYDSKIAVAAVTMTLGIIEFGTGIWVSICLCVMKPCCTDLDLEEREPLVASVTD